MFSYKPRKSSYYSTKLRTKKNILLNRLQGKHFLIRPFRRENVENFLGDHIHSHSNNFFIWFLWSKSTEEISRVRDYRWVAQAKFDAFLQTNKSVSLRFAHRRYLPFTKSINRCEVKNKKKKHHSSYWCLIMWIRHFTLRFIYKINQHYYHKTFFFKFHTFVIGFVIIIWQFFEERLKVNLTSVNVSWFSIRSL